MCVNESMDVKPISSTMAQHSNNKVISNGSAHCISAQKAKRIFEAEEVNLSLAAPRSKLHSVCLLHASLYQRSVHNKHNSQKLTKERSTDYKYHKNNHGQDLSTVPSSSKHEWFKKNINITMQNTCKISNS